MLGNSEMLSKNLAEIETKQFSRTSKLLTSLSANEDDLISLYKKSFRILLTKSPDYIKSFVQYNLSYNLVI